MPLYDDRSIYRLLEKWGIYKGVNDNFTTILHPIRNGLLEGYDNKYLLVGFDTKGNPIEIMYNRIDEEKVNVFHAMKCRKEFLK